MLSAHGILAIVSQPRKLEWKANKLRFLQFRAISSRKGKRYYYIVRVGVPEQTLQEAEQELKLHKVIHIRHGDWDAQEGKEQVLRVNWRDMDVLGWFDRRRSER